MNFNNEVTQIQSMGVIVEFCVDTALKSTKVNVDSIQTLMTSDSTSDSLWVKKAYPYYDPEKKNSANNISNQENLEKIDFQTLLCQNENVCQTKLNEVLVENMKVVIDTSVKSCGMFSAAKSVGSVDAVSVPSAIPDITDKLSPQLIEIKGSPPTMSEGLVTTDVELVCQMLTRISTIINTAGFLRSFTVIGATGRSAWVMEFIRNVENFKQRGYEFERIEIRRIPHSEVLKIFLSNHERSKIEKYWFFTCDAPHIINTISRLSYPFWCSVRLLDCSESRVYYVALPRVYDDLQPNNKTRKVVGPTAKKKDFAIKIVHDNAQFAVEVEALAAISCQYNAMPNNIDNSQRHYAIGSCSIGGDAVKSLEKLGLHEKSENSDTLNSSDILIDFEQAPGLQIQLAVANLTQQYLDLVNNPSTQFQQFDLHPWVQSSHPCDWRDTRVLRDSLISKELEGGAIVMRIGSVLTKDELNASVWFDGVCKCLRAGWQVGWSQGDVRTRNILKFGDDSYQLIDYNHAVQLTESDGNEAVRYGYRMFSEGSLYNSLGPSLANRELKQEVKWYATDDYEMCMTALRNRM